MAYIEIKTINGRKYKYLRKSVRKKDGRIVHEMVKYLGPVEPKYNMPKEKKDEVVIVEI